MQKPPPLVFLGPSLPQAEARALCPGEYHGPIARGDLPALAGTEPRAVVIIDGRFEHVRAVSPKEILHALDMGHAVYGAASIGALRAVELKPFGMQGVGRIYTAFQCGDLVADDEVAVAFDPITLRPLSEPLAGIRVALAEATAVGLITAAEAGRLRRCAEELPYARRTYERLVAASLLPPERRRALLDFLRQRATDLKAEDARAVLRHVAAGWSRGPCMAGDLPLRGQPPAPGPALDALPAAPKCGPWDSVRTLPVSETEACLDRVRALVGITRVGDVQGLDFLSVPNFIAVRPSRDRDCNSVYSGKGLRSEDARVGAQMEALEMACGLDDRVPLERASYRQLVRVGRRAVHPDALIPLFGAPRDLTVQGLEWTTGWDIVSGEAVLVPANVVFFRRRKRPLHWKISSNGLASGNTLAEALAHGLAEVIERDAETMFRLATEYAHLPGLLRVVAGPARIVPPAGAPPPPREFPLIRLRSLPAPLLALVERFRARGVRVALRRITSDVDIATVLCVLWEPTGDARRHLVQYGCGTHPDPCIAARRAITEAAQSRVTAIQGAREDLEAGAIASGEPPVAWFDGGEDGIDFSALTGAAHVDVLADIRFMVERLSAAGLPEMIAVDLTNPVLGFPVVKVVVPGLELAFHAVNPDCVTFGWRARRYFEPDARAEQPTGALLAG